MSADETPRILLQTERFRVEEVTRSLPGGGSRTRSVVRHPGAVAIVPVLDDGRICLIANYRVSIGKTLWEIPAGTLEPNEGPAATAERELTEETGFRAARWERLASYYLSPGILDELMHVFVARELTAGDPAREPGEEIENHCVPLAEALAMIDDGRICDAKTIAALLLYDRRLPRTSPGIPRVLEPEVMDSPEEAFAYDTMDHSAVNRAFAEDFLAFAPEPGDVLDLGTGTALIPIEIVRRHAECRIKAVDLAISMLELARYNVEAHGATGRIELEHLDAKTLPFAEETFTSAISNSIVHHLPDPAPALAEMVRVTTRGGALFVRDLMRPRTKERVSELVALYAAEANAEQRALFEASLHAALTLEEIRAIVASLGFAPESVQATSDRHWTWAARKA